MRKARDRDAGNTVNNIRGQVKGAAGQRQQSRVLGTGGEGAASPTNPRLRKEQGNRTGHFLLQK